MAKQVKLKAEARTNVGRSGVRKLRARGIIPAVIYGGKVKPQPLQVAARDINAMMSHASGENVLVDLEIAGEKSNRAALVQEVQHSPVGGEIVTHSARMTIHRKAPTIRVVAPGPSSRPSPGPSPRSFQPSRCRVPPCSGVAQSSANGVCSFMHAP